MSHLKFESIIMLCTFLEFKIDDKNSQLVIIITWGLYCNAVYSLDTKGVDNIHSMYTSFVHINESVTVFLYPCCSEMTTLII